MFKLLIRDRKSKVYEGEVESITARDALGEFQVFEGYESLIKIIEAGEIKISTGAEKKSVTVEFGMLRSGKDKVEILCKL